MTAPAAQLWDELRTILRHAVAVFGEPARLLDDLVLPRAETRRLAAWLGALEAAARALLTLMALRQPAPAPLRAGASRARVAPPTDEKPPQDGAPPPPEPDDSERWAGVVFRIAPERRPSGRPGGRRPPMRFAFVRPLAFRLEALIRVAAAPEPFARRLARRLAADGAFVRRVLRRPAQAKDRPPPYEELVEDALAAAWEAVRSPAPETG